MTARSGLTASIGFGDESPAWGNHATPTVWVPMRDESLGHEIERLESEAIIAGQRVLRSQQWAEGGVTASGDIGLEVNDQSKGLLLKHMMGGSGTTGPFPPADMAGNGMTVQVGVPDVDTGTVRPKTLIGGKVASWELGLVTGEIATLGLSTIGKQIVGHRAVTDGVLNSTTTVTSATAAFVQDDVGSPISATGITAGTTIASVESATSITLSVAATATASSVAIAIGMPLTTPSYATGIMPMSFIGGSLTIGGAAQKVRELTLAGDNGLSDDRRYIGNRAVDEPLEQALRAYTGTIETDYFSDVNYRRFLSGAEFAMVATIARGTKSLIATTNIRFDGETPKVAGRGIVGQTLPFVCVGTTTDASAISFALDET